MTGKNGSRNPRSKEMKVINHTSVAWQWLTVRISFSIVSTAYDNTQITLITLSAFKLSKIIFVVCYFKDI